MPYCQTVNMFYQKKKKRPSHTQYLQRHQRCSLQLQKSKTTTVWPISITVFRNLFSSKAVFHGNPSSHLACNHHSALEFWINQFPACIYFFFLISRPLCRDSHRMFPKTDLNWKKATNHSVSPSSAASTNLQISSMNTSPHTLCLSGHGTTQPGRSLNSGRSPITLCVLNKRHLTPQSMCHLLSFSGNVCKHSLHLH